ncbi:MAG: hypothetical protein COW88_00220 [Candidatus Lloydbacteria bacterium CG22_combo_CG10-13_8_21_14_all_47_15]|uniref:Prepilin-type N-terminal cleavage/methylation domain-containing protein n=1 Tax=Candidatus Lloydbacteria bacterium CG22_combo_CG10-13_8_21_14_all_47_15 TaxID=1974635 RepID=A0A2H0CVR9_9BACT|nr:MAG: hypothetical protein COW88_00220 [Candidatus Lloydbacteria bacterium CG22_combo_CG10-13_8_21_14_all_47_15]
MGYSVHKKTSGFTLVEVIISIGLFVAVMTIAVSALISLMDAQRRAQAFREVMDNIDFAMENISRSLRLGANYHCGPSGGITTPQDCPGGDDYIAFTDVLGGTTIFRLENGVLERSTDGGSTFLALTSPSVTIHRLDFFVNGTAAGDLKQPGVRIVVGGLVELSKGATNFDIETFVTQRLLDS